LCRHSETYRKVYHPAYRLVGEEAARFLPLLQALDSKLSAGETVTLAIDGPSGSGKSSMASWLKKVYGDCEVFHMDDFFLPPEKKTPKRLNTPGGNVDWERFLEEVLVPIKAGKPFSYRPYDCGECALGDAVTAAPRRLNLVEGVYSLHPALREAYDLKLFLSIDRQEQLRRILKRSGPAMQRRFIQEWIPLEDLYFQAMYIKDISDLIL
jgi:uridine kinase